MSATPSTMLELGTSAPEFTLPEAGGDTVSMSDFADKPALLVMFICAHCPFVQHLRDHFARLLAEYQAKGLAVVAINSNDIDKYPQDGPSGMREEKAEVGYTFPYLFDDSQQVAQAYRAACTPDFFVFDAGRKLRYRGQYDDSRPGNSVPVTGEDLRAALDSVLAGDIPDEDQKPSIGCNIKWKPGNEPDYFG